MTGSQPSSDVWITVLILMSDFSRDGRSIRSHGQGILPDQSGDLLPDGQTPLSPCSPIPCYGCLKECQCVPEDYFHRHLYANCSGRAIDTFTQVSLSSMPTNTEKIYFEDNKLKVIPRGTFMDVHKLLNL